MKPKYVEERFPRWFVFGESESTVDLADPDGDVFQSISRPTAAKLIATRDRFVDDLCEIFADDPEALYRLLRKVTKG